MSDFEYLEYAPQSGEVKKIVFTFHGYGRNAWFMDKVGKEIQEAFPSTKIYGLHAPEKLSMPKKLDVSNMNMPEELLQDDHNLHEDMQRQWFSMRGVKIKIWLRMWKLAPKINGFVDQEQDQFGLKDKDIVYIGFSQGGAVALYSALRRKCPIAAIVAHSAVYWGLMPVRSKLPIYFLYGDQDPSISEKLYRHSIKKLKNHAKPLEVEELMDQGHYINSRSRQKLVKHLKDYLV